MDPLSEPVRRRGSSGRKGSDLDEFMPTLRHPRKAELEALRDAILSTSPRIEETIKWSVPTFTFEGNMASLMIRNKRFAHLVFHEGVALPDPDGILEGNGKQLRSIRTASLEDVKRLRLPLQRMVQAWIELQSRVQN